MQVGKICLPLAKGCPPREIVALELRLSSHPRELDTSRVDDSSNGDAVEDEGLVLEVTPALKVTLVLTQRADKKLMSYQELGYQKVLDHKSVKQ